MPAIKSNWERTEGSMLQQASDEGMETLNGVVPASSGIYMWKLATLPLDYLNISANDFVNFLNNRCSATISKSGSSQSGRVFIKDYEIRGTPIPKEKSDTLITFLKGPRQRKMKKQLSSLLRATQLHTPSLYVGEAQNLRLRLFQHLQGSTPFGKMVLDSEDMDFTFFDFWHYELSDGLIEFQSIEEETQIRKTYEYIVTMLTIGGHTKRSG